MPTTTVEKLSPTRSKLTITVTPDELKPSIDSAYKVIAEQVNIPGFRRGKVPPRIIDQRVGKAAVLQEVVGSGLDSLYRDAVSEHGVHVMGRPEASILELPSEADFSGDLIVAIEVNVRPDITLPEMNTLTLTVDSIDISEAEVSAAIDRLRSRFGTLITVERPAKTGDFVTLDLVATIDGKEVDAADGISYELGSGELLAGIDDALDTLTAGESTTFKSTLLGGDHEGEEAEVAVTVTAVKESELPEADDDFAQVASEFDTYSELLASVREEVLRSKRAAQARQARDHLLEKLRELIVVPVIEEIIEEEVRHHLEGEGRLDDEEHRSEVIAESRQSYQDQVILDTLAERQKVQVSEQEITQYLLQAAAQYRMEPSEFFTRLRESGQLVTMAAEARKNKALALALGKVTVEDTSGTIIDLSDFTVSEGEAKGDSSEQADVSEDTEAAASSAKRKPRKTAKK